MSLFFSLFVRCFWLPLFAAVVLSAGRLPRQPGRWFAWFVGGVLAGAAAVAWLPESSATLFWFAAVRGALLVLALLLLLTRRAFAVDALWFAAGLLGAAPFFAAPVMSAFSTTSVVNTSFILHFAAVLAAAGLSALLALWCCARWFRAAYGARWLCWSFSLGWQLRRCGSARIWGWRR